MLKSFDLRQWLSALGHLVRWREWKAHKLPFFLVGMCYAVLRMAAPGAAELGRMTALLVLLCLFAAFGHVVNDYADREVDRAAGKRKILAGFSEPAALIALAIPGLGTIAVAAAFFDTRTLLLAIVAVMVAAIYSLPPFRLKERALLGWAAATLAQRTLPLAIVFEAFGAWDWAAVLFCILGTILGVRHIIIHQLLDRDNDLTAGVRTVATQYSPQRVERLLIYGLFPLEVFCGFATVAAMSYFEHPLGLVGLAYAALLIIVSAQGRQLSPLSYATFWEFYYVIWPISLSVLLAIRNPMFLSVVAVSIALVAGEARRIFSAMFAVKQAIPARKPPSPTHQPPAAPDRNQAVAAAGPNKIHANNRIQFNKADPYPFYAQLRARGPVHQLDWASLGKNWMVTRHREALTVFKDPRFVKSMDSVEGSDGLVRPAQVVARGLGLGLLEADPPDHTRLRRLVSKAFTPAFVTRFRDRIEQLADQILDRAKARGGIELISEYASVIPITIIGELLGMPISNTDAARKFLYSLSLSRIIGLKNDALEAEKNRFFKRLEAIFAARRQSPRDDLMTALVQANQDGDKLSSDELLEMVHLLLLAGFVTTVNLIGNGTLALLRHPQQLDLLRQKPELINTAIEELLRFDSPLELSSVHYASTEVELGGQVIPGGEAIRVIIPSANHDESTFVDPDKLDITRTPCPHLSFGQGIHHCLGAPLARLEGTIAINKLLERITDLPTIDPLQVQWLLHPALRGLQRLPLRLPG